MSGKGRDRASEPELDAMGNDKRRAVIGRQYGATARKRVASTGSW